MWSMIPPGAKDLHSWHKVLLESEKTDADKVLIAAIILLSTQHDPKDEKRSFSHLTFEEIWDKLSAHYDELRKACV